MMSHRLDTRVGTLVTLAVTLLLLGGCSKSGSNGSDSGPGRVDANPTSSELFDHEYGYLIEGDPDFTRLAPNYSTLRPFNPDSAIVTTSNSLAEGVTNPGADYKDYLHITVRRPMTLRVVIADSTGGGVIAYEFENLATGDYTLGKKGWPVPQVDHCKDLGWVYVYVIGDNRFRWRDRFGLDDHKNLVPLGGTEQAS